MRQSHGRIILCNSGKSCHVIVATTVYSNSFTNNIFKNLWAIYLNLQQEVTRCGCNLFYQLLVDLLNIWNACICGRYRQTSSWFFSSGFHLKRWWWRQETKLSNCMLLHFYQWRLYIHNKKLHNLKNRRYISHIYFQNANLKWYYNN